MNNRNGTVEAPRDADLPRPADRVHGLMRIVRRVDRWYFEPFIGQSTRLIRRSVASVCGSLIDVGCGSASKVQAFSSELTYSVGVDISEDAVRESRNRGIHTAYAVIDITRLDQHFPSRSFDCVLASDVIEHLDKEAGDNLIRAMERIARRRVVIFTPNGFLPQRAYGGNPFQEHLSGWTVEEMKSRGYRVAGINGWKPLRGERAIPRRPGWLTARLSLLTQPLVFARPRFAFQLLCVKDVAKGQGVRSTGLH
jgi:SAM-dependent methyltransferase